VGVSHCGAGWSVRIADDGDDDDAKARPVVVVVVVVVIAGTRWANNDSASEMDPELGREPESERDLVPSLPSFVPSLFLSISLSLASSKPSN
jgi:hypothetical protein